MNSDFISAAQLPPGGCGLIIELRHPEPLRVRLMELGIVPGAKLLRKYTAPSGSPIAFEAAGAVTAIRKRDAVQILVREVQAPWTP